MGSLLAYLLGAMAVSFLCSVLEAVLMSTPISYITMREEEGYKPATLFKEYKQIPSPIPSVPPVWADRRPCCSAVSGSASFRR